MSGDEVKAERDSIETIIHKFDELFNDQSLKPIINQDEWDIWKKWYEKQKTQYLREEIPIETFYGQMRQLNEFFMIH